jgi:hypothetical protein
MVHCLEPQWTISGSASFVRMTICAENNDALGSSILGLSAEDDMFEYVVGNILRVLFLQAV